jgi:preprotein translocase subunit SecA
MSSVTARLAFPAGAYPERLERPPGTLDRLATRLIGPVVRWARRRRVRAERLVPLVAEHGRALDGLSDRALREAAQALRPALRRDGFSEDLVARVFALVREAAWRTLKQRHFDVQIIGGQALLAGMVAEMDTGEGKTLTATLAASAAALAGIPVHIVTVNDYLASRDAEWMGPIYRALGLQVGTVVHGMAPTGRRQAYACDVTYCTNKELAFDYLRDRIVLRGRPSWLQLQIERLGGREARAERLVLRGLHFAIVDEADSVLVDEGRTPLIISAGGSSAEQRLYETALGVADQLVPERDFSVDMAGRTVRLTPEGLARLDELAAPLGGVWAGRLRREELARQALVARQLFQRDRHYLVRDGRVQIIDEYTGRLMPDRSWERGLHQLIEVKEGVPVTAHHDTLARISYQRFFRRYLRLAGMTGTAREVAGEVWAVYGLPVVRVPTNRPSRRVVLPERVYRSAEARWVAVVERVRALHAAGRPVLVGTRSVAASEELAARLAAAGLPHRVLNARQDIEEAQIIAEAGQPGRITVATNMAGRGTDIRLAPAVLERGGLHVIATERHDAGRIDRQLFGRCGRQGDPGSAEALASLEDDLVATHGGAWRRLVAPLGRASSEPSRLAGLAVRQAQRAAERAHGRMRRDLLRFDEQMDSTLAFSGPGE